MSVLSCTLVTATNWQLLILWVSIWCAVLCFLFFKSWEFFLPTCRLFPPALIPCMGKLTCPLYTEYTKATVRCFCSLSCCFWNVLFSWKDLMILYKCSARLLWSVLFPFPSVRDTCSLCVCVCPVSLGSALSFPCLVGMVLFTCYKNPDFCVLRFQYIMTGVGDKVRFLLFDTFFVGLRTLMPH